MYIGNLDQNSEMQEQSTYKIVFTYPGTPKSVPLTNVVRKGNTLAFFFRTIPDKAAFDKLVGYAEGDFVNPAPHLTKNGVHRKCYQKCALTGQWEEMTLGYL